ncbi:MAG: cytochrome d ubiquinol oxidase subunit II [Deltaproteobacteria bacterium]|jgi:cytochrome d ubiquinol oxidase subunit II|nr:cytochrome d ubiquinol oxidase subunit II [Deltaproteobacteria bacterium]
MDWQTILPIIWFIVWGVLWGVYFVLDGYDLGIAMWVPLLGASSEKERATMHQVTGPFWDANEVWLITAGGVTFAAFPLAYSVLFSSLYSPLMILLFCLILRGVCSELRFQWDNLEYRWVCDGLIALTSLVAAVLLGVAFSNLFRGLPLEYDAQNQFYMFRGNILNLLHPYCLLGGVVFVLMFMVHGTLYLAWRVAGDLRNKAVYMSKMVWPIFLLLFLIYVVLTFAFAGLYVNYFSTPPLLALPLLCAVLFLLSGWELYKKENAAKSLLYSCGGIFALTMTGVIGMYPNVIPSRLAESGSVTIAAAASSTPTLTIMLVVALICVPIVIIYQIWAHRKLAVTINADY